MSRRTSHKCCRLTATVFLLLAGVCACTLGASLHAAEPLAATQQSGELAFRRVFVPADSPEDWPVGDQRYLPIPQTVFFRHLRDIPPAASPPQQSPTHIKRAVYRVKLMPDDVLQGKAEWSVQLSGNVPRLLPMAPLNLAIQSAQWRSSPTQAAWVGLWQRDENSQELAVLTKQSDTLLFSWELAAQRSDATRAVFDLEMPIVVPQTLELLLPANHSASLSSAKLLHSDSGPQGESTWMFQLAPHEKHQLQIERVSPARATHSQPLVSQTNSYQLKPSGLTATTHVRLDARETSFTELKASVPSGLRVVAVSIDRQPVDWHVVENSFEHTLSISHPDSKQPQSVEIHSLAKFRPNRSWELPKLRFEDVAWTEGTTSLLVSPQLELRSLTPRQATLQHIVGIAGNSRKSNTQSGEVFRLQEWSEEAAIEIEVGRPRAILSSRVATTIELGRDEVQATTVAEFSTSGQEVYQIEAAVAGSWSIDSVSTTPKSALNEWHLDRAGNSSQLRLQLNQPVSSKNALLVEIKSRKTTGGSVLPATVGQLKLLRFQQAKTEHHWLHLRTRESSKLILADRLDRARLSPAAVTPELRLLLPESTLGTLLDTSSLSDGELVEFRPQPAQYQVQLQITIDALPDTFRQSYQMDCHWQAGAISEVFLELQEPLPESLLWNLVGQRGTLTAERIEESEAEQTSSPKGIRYLLRLPVAMSEDFRLQASYSQSAQKMHQCNLISLPQSINWRGQICLRGSLTRIQVLDQGWTPISYSSNQADEKLLPVIGTYRLGPEEFRRGMTSAGLRLRRLSPEPSAPEVVAWLAEYSTHHAANGAAQHIAGYSLENSGTGEVRILLPEGADFQGAWLDDQEIDPEQIASEGRAYKFRFGQERRWPYLALKYSTHIPALGRSASIQPAVPDCSFPINTSRWTLWAPRKYTIDASQQKGHTQQISWWKRVFGPLDRPQGESVFNPFSSASWAQLGSISLLGQQTNQVAGKLANQLAERLVSGSDQPLGTVLSEITDQHQASELFYVDRIALLARGIQANTSCQKLVAENRALETLRAQSLPLSSYRLALMVSPGTIVLTTAERVAHRHHPLRPTESPGVFLAHSEEFGDRSKLALSFQTAKFLHVADWKKFPPVEGPQWVRRSVRELADYGRRAQTVEFVEGLPALIVRRDFFQRAIWYAVFLLTLVLGIWQLSPFPNTMILAGTIAGAACLIAPPNWLFLPQAIFLGLIAAAIVHVVRKTLEVGGESYSRPKHKIVQGTVLFLLSQFPALALAQAVVSPDVEPAIEKRLPRVLFPINSQGERQGEEVYVPEDFLAKLQQPPERGENEGTQLVLLSATYHGSLSHPSLAAGPPKSSLLKDPWTLIWKVESFVPNCRLHLPLQRDEAIWSKDSHRLDGLPVELDWQAEGNGCSVTLLETGTHWLQIVAQPRVVLKGSAVTLQLHVPPFFGAKLDLALSPNINDLRVKAAGPTRFHESDSRLQTVLAASDTVTLQWTPVTTKASYATWERLEQFSWLHIDPTASRFEVELALKASPNSPLLLELEVSPQLRLTPPSEGSPIAEVLPPSVQHPSRLQLRLREGLPAKFVIPLRFELQRASSVGRFFFPKVRLMGPPPDLNLFAVSVSAGLSFEESVSNSMQGMKPSEFSEFWSATTDQPLYAYSLGQELPVWSLRVRPDPRSLDTQQTLRVLCLPGQAQVDFEAAVDDLTGSWLSHRVEVPKSLQIDSISVQTKGDQADVPVRWSRVSASEAVVFFGRPLQQPHGLKLLGHMKASLEDEVALPKVQLINEERSEIHLDLYRTEDVQVSWSHSGLVPEEILQQRVSRNREYLHVGHFSWRSSETRPLSKIRIERNNQQFDATSVTTVHSEQDGWSAQLSSRLSVRKGVISRLSLVVPESFSGPYELLPKQTGVIEEEVRVTSRGKVVTVLLAQPALAGEEIEVQLSGKLNLPAGQRLVVPSLQWGGASRNNRFVLLPTLIDGQSIEWQKSGLRRQPLPKSLAPYVSEREGTLAYHVEQNQFEAKERSHRGTLRIASMRSSKVSGILDESGLLTATAEFTLQPGRATSCGIQLPAQSQLLQLIVGDVPVRRNLLDSGHWKVPLGSPFMPQRIVVSYRTHQKTNQHFRFLPPKIFLGDQALPTPRTWWRIQPTHNLQLYPPETGNRTEEIRFVKENYRHSQLVLETAFSQALELPKEESLAWFQTWQKLIRQAETAWLTYDLSEDEKAELAADAETRLEFAAAFGADYLTTATRPSLLKYPPKVPRNPLASPPSKSHFFISDSRGQLVFKEILGTQKNLWHWFVATALVCGVSAILLRMRHLLQWHEKLCHWPHSLALSGGFIWWLLLKPSAVGMLVLLLTLTSLALQQWRSYRLRRHPNPETPLAASTG